MALRRLLGSRRLLVGVAAASIVAFFAGIGGWPSLVVLAVALGVLAFRADGGDVPRHTHRTVALIAALAIATSVAGVIGNETVTAGNDSTLDSPWDVIVPGGLWITVLIVIPVAVALARPHWRSVVLVTVVIVVGLVLADMLAFEHARAACGGDADLCDPGPIPQTIMVISLPLLTWPASLIAIAFRGRQAQHP